MTSTSSSLAIIGGGNMGTALIAGLIAGGVSAGSIVVVEIDDEKRDAVARQFGVRTSSTIISCDSAIVAVKPQSVVDVCIELRKVAVQRVVSIAAGISLATLERALGSDIAAIRAMPNTPALVGEGVSGFAVSANCSPADIDWAESILAAVGVVVRVPEEQIDAVTAVASSGPGYLFLIAEALIDAGVAQGLAPDVAQILVKQLFRGSGILLAQSPETASTLRERVTSPNGTTAAGLMVLENAKIRQIVDQAVSAAAARSREMGA
ncbi:MAG: pyrroline-5-carboxylate reductase [Ilumatobacteraceae bacterium]|nr:pyrroline-5-carboxylate reductase [Ilumatobacteraceae bacterium]